MAWYRVWAIEHWIALVNGGSLAVLSYLFEFRLGLRHVCGFVRLEML